MKAITDHGKNKAMRFTLLGIPLLFSCASIFAKAVKLPSDIENAYQKFSMCITNTNLINIREVTCGVPNLTWSYSSENLAQCLRTRKNISFFESLGKDENQSVSIFLDCDYDKKILLNL